MKRVFTILLAGACLLLTLSACGKAPGADFRSVRDTGTEATLSLGMTYEAAEKALGDTLVEDPTDPGSTYYSSAGAEALTLNFREGILRGVTTRSPAFQLQGGFGVGSQISQLGDGWVITQLSDSDDAAFRNFDAKGNLLLEATGEAVVMQTLFFFDGSETAVEAGLYTLD